MKSLKKFKIKNSVNLLGEERLVSLSFITVEIQSLFSGFSRELTAVDDDNRLFGLVVSVNSVAFYHIENVKAVSDFAEDAVGTIEMGSGDEAEEELGAVGVGSSVGHGEDTSTLVLVYEVLIGESLSVDGGSTSSVSGGEITSLSHELRNDSVESASLEVESLTLWSAALLTCAESSEVLRGLWSVSCEVHSDSAGSLTANGNVEEDL